jgi:DNA polymerase-1
MKLATAPERIIDHTHFDLTKIQVPEIIESLDQLPQIPAGLPIVVDTETTSGEDFSHGNAFDGKTKACGYAVALSPDIGFYIPIRHRDGFGNLPVEPVLDYLRGYMEDGRTVCNQNIKFDLKHWHNDGIHPKGRLEDTMGLIRLLECDRLSYALDAMARAYLGKKKLTDSIKGFLESLAIAPEIEVRGKKQKVKNWDRRTRKDYGLVPVRLMGPYARTDACITYELRNYGLRNLPAISWQVWDTECELTYWLSKWEITGIPVNKRAIKETWLHCVREMMEITQALNELIEPEVGHEFDPSSDAQLTEFLVGMRGVVVKAFTEKEKKPQWNGMALRTIDADDQTKKIGETIAKYRNTAAFSGSFCEGWLNRIGHDDRMHPDFRQSGTATGRLSCADPNMQNVPPRAENFVETAEGRVLIAFDYSQIEYRIFGHYTDDPLIVDEYRNNPDADFHGFLAKILGVDRQFAKQLNFSFLYGMGKEKLLRNLSGILTLKADESDEMREKMRLMAYGAGTSISQRAKQLNATEESKLMAEQIYKNYHAKFPSIRQFQKRVASAISVRGWIRNFFGRVYVLPEAAIHKGVNYIIQGTAADLFKDRLVDLFKQLTGKYDYTMVTNVHDSAIFDVSMADGEGFYWDAKKILEKDVGLKLPIKVEGKLSTKTWGTVVKVKDSFTQAVEESRTALTRLAGLARHEWDDPNSKTKGRYEFGPAPSTVVRVAVTDIEATAIKAEFARGRVTIADLAKRYNCERSAVEMAIKG